MTIEPEVTQEVGQAIYDACQEFDLKGADSVEVVWVDGHGGPQPLVWPMRLGATRQGNLSGPMIRGMQSFSHRGDH